MQMECILEDSDFPDSKCLSFCALDDLDSVADVKGHLLFTFICKCPEFCCFNLVWKNLIAEADLREY